MTLGVEQPHPPPPQHPPPPPWNDDAGATLRGVLAAEKSLSTRGEAHAGHSTDSEDERTSLSNS